MANLNLNLTTSSGLSPSLQTWYSDELLRNIKPRLIHYEHAQKKPMPRNHGKTVDFRKWSVFPPITTALTEGVTPDGQDLNQTHITATVADYGGYVSVSDVLTYAAADPVIQDAVVLMADQGGLSIDRVIRNAVHAGVTNVQYAGSNAALATIASTDKLTMAEIRKAVRTLKKNRAPQFTRGGMSFYKAIVGPDTVYDLQSDSTWQAVAQYQDKEKIYSGEIGRIFGVVFIENTESMVYGAPALSTTTKVSSYATSTKKVTLDRALNDDEKDTIMAVKKVKIGSTTQAVDSISGAVITLSGTVSTDPAANDEVSVVGPGASGAKVAATLVFGQNSYGVIDIGGGNVRSIVKPLGSGGAADPLDQKATVGWKAQAIATKVLQPAWIVQVLHGISD